jgi:hypothetical protein
MNPAIDASLYPDRKPPADLSSEYEAADYLQRVCAAFDFGVIPAGAVLEELRRHREIFDRYPLPASPAYHALRRWFGWPAVLGRPPMRLRYEQRDLRENRPPDPCARHV